jgi:uncharacterized NAD-dependent epimerase/dehydratase family protein
MGKGVVGLRNFSISDKPIILSFLRKQGNKVIWIREEKGKKDERTVH